MSWKDILKTPYPLSLGPYPNQLRDRKTLMVNTIKSDWKPHSLNPELEQWYHFAYKWVMDNPEKTADALVAMKPAMDYWDELREDGFLHDDNELVANSVIERFYMDIKELERDVEADMDRTFKESYQRYNSKGDLE